MLKKLIVLSILLSIASVLSGAIDWIFQFTFIVVIYFLASYIFFIKDYNSIYFLILILPFTVVYGLSLIISHTQNSVVYPIVFSPLIGFLAAFFIIQFKIRKYILIPIWCSLLIISSFIFMENWFIFISNKNRASNNSFPKLNLKDADNKEFNLSKGHIYVIDIWSSTCGICIEEFPAFELKKTEYANQKDIIFLTLNLPIKYSKSNLWEKHVESFSFASLTTTDSAGWEKLNVQSVPDYLIVDKELKIRYQGSFNYKKIHFVNNFDNVLNKIKNNE